MAKYSSKPVVVNRPASDLAAKFSDFSILQESLDKMSPERRETVGDVSFTSDTICINTPQIGEIRLRATERTSDRITLKAEGTPVAMELQVNLRPVDETRTEVEGVIDVEIPAMLRPMVGSTLQKAADKFGELFAQLA